MTSTSLKVLVVDDSRATRDLIASVLEGWREVEVITASSGFEALKLLPRHRFSLIVTDLNMPDINGLELINFVKKNPMYQATPLWVVTTDGRDVDRDKSMMLGADEYIVKPFDPETLLSLLKKHIK